TRDIGENAEAYWSYDNKQLVFQSKRPPFKCDQIMTMPADGSAEPKLVSTGKGRTTCAYFFPGNEEIVYSSTHDRSPECPPEPDFSKGYVWGLYDYDVYKANADGSNLRRLTNREGYDAEATVCPTDGSIIFTSDRDGDLELYRMDSDGSNVVRLTNTPGYDGGAFFSKDCSQIVWRAARPKGAELDEFRALLKQKLVRPSKLEIFVANADGSNIRQITYLDTAAFAPYFHPSGKRVLFSTSYGDRRGREFNIWAINTDGTNLKQITYAPGFDGFPMFSFDGTKLAFASNRNQAKERETDVYVARWVDNPPDKSTAQSPADRFLENVAWLADDAREGRGVGTKGLDQSADWLADKFKQYGATGVADSQGGYKQMMSVATGLRREPATEMVIDGKTIADDAFVPTWFSARKAVRAQTVFAGYGIQSKALGIDDYKRVRARGKIAVVRRFTPSRLSSDDQRRHGDLQYKAFIARKNGAIGLIVVDVPAPGESAQREARLPPLKPDGAGDAGIPVVVVTRAAGAALLRGRHTARLNVSMATDEQPVYNVVGKITAGAADRLPGAVVIGAHYDHLGHGHPGSLELGRKVIHNGADDNASGTAGLLEATRLLAAQRDKLRRDVYVVAFTAEESGLLGSAHFVKNLPDQLKAENIIAMLNMDMIGRLRDNSLAVLGIDSAAEWTE
ncbi:MAG: M20/M25/M40 family metallo-hydrolase, partial [Myxococcota bacterium]